MAKTIYTQESKLGWVMITHADTGFRELLQIGKIIGVKELEEEGLGLCRIKYYNPIKNENVDYVPVESFEDIAEQMGIEFDGEK